MSIYIESKTTLRGLNEIVMKYASVERILPDKNPKKPVDFTHSDNIYTFLKQCSNVNTKLFALKCLYEHYTFDNLYKSESDRETRAHYRGACFLYFKETLDTNRKQLENNPKLLRTILQEMPTFALWVMNRYEQKEIDEFHKSYRHCGVNFRKDFNDELESRRSKIIIFEPSNTSFTIGQLCKITEAEILELSKKM